MAAFDSTGFGDTKAVFTGCADWAKLAELSRKEAKPMSKIFFIPVRFKRFDKILAFYLKRKPKIKVSTGVLYLRFMKKVLLIASLVLVLAGCKANKKNRCNTCPKWDDRIEMTEEVGIEKLGRP